VKDLREYALPIKTVPSLWSILSGKDALTSIKMIEPEDILFRPPTYNESGELASFFQGKRIMITGAGGSIGSEVARQVASFMPETLILYERHEESLYNIDMALRGPRAAAGSFICPVIGDILDGRRLDEVMQRFRPEIVLHAAAYKHVPLMEENSSEAFKTNVFGTKMMAEKSREHGVRLFVMVSTDKAVNPVNVMGMTKKIAEEVVRYFSEDGKNNEVLKTGISEGGKFTTSRPFNLSSSTRFITVRFGNVLESSGSVVPLFNEQIRKGGPVTVTHPQMTRYFMTIPEAVTLVLQAATMGRGGEIFVLDMGTPVKILDLAKRMISLYGYRPGVDIDVAFIGLRPGEKLFEELFNIDEIIQGTMHPKINMAVSARRINRNIVATLDDANFSPYAADIKDVIVRLAE
jgi:FlaA1/EpsC-like NDP-sugar epimerase